jgi:myo-inositol-1(or 4)-monophosphatase
LTRLESGARNCSGAPHGPDRGAGLAISIAGGEGGRYSTAMLSPDLDPVALVRLRETVRAVAVEAGAMALRSFRPGETTSARIWNKPGGSPVTDADVAVDAFLKVSCAAILPQAAWLSEETADDAARLGSPLVWVVDPIDGTRAFMAGVPDWCVCVALLAADRPVLGVVHAPALGVTYLATAGGGAALAAGERTLRPLDLTGRAAPDEPRLAGPKPMLEALSRHMPLSPQPKVPSLALRLARIAAADIDGGLVSPDSRDWDLAAADLVLTEAGGRIAGLDGAALVYNRPAPVHGMLMAAQPALFPRLSEAAKGLRGRNFGRG